MDKIASDGVKNIRHGKLRGAHLSTFCVNQLTLHCYLPPPSEDVVPNKHGGGNKHVGGTFFHLCRWKSVEMWHYLLVWVKKRGAV